MAHIFIEIDKKALKQPKQKAQMQQPAPAQKAVKAVQQTAPQTQQQAAEKKTVRAVRQTAPQMQAQTQTQQPATGKKISSGAWIWVLTILAAVVLTPKQNNRK